MEQAVIIPEAQALAVISPMAIDEIIGQVNLIQSVMGKVMKEGEHFGVIPGTGNKPSLLKPGAEKLSMTFRMAPEYDIQAIDMGGDHREYEIVCRLSTIQTGIFLGSGVGNCNTKESKYRYRSENTGESVPKKYWENRDPDLLGGKQFRAKKKDKKWVICEQVEHDNPADYYNTVKKMAKKRAFVDAVLTVTAASDIFTQDIEDLPHFDKEDIQKPKDIPPLADQTNHVDQANRLIKLMNGDETAKGLQKRYEDNLKLVASFPEKLKKQVFAYYWTRKKAITRGCHSLVSEEPIPQNEEETPPLGDDDLPPVFDEKPFPGEPTAREKAIRDAKAHLDSASKDQLPEFMTSLKATLDKMPLDDQGIVRSYYESLLKK